MVGLCYGMEGVCHPRTVIWIPWKNILGVVYFRGREIPTAALDFWFLGPYGGITVLTDSETLVMVCLINAIVVLVKPWLFVLLPIVFNLFRKMSGGFRYFPVHEYRSTNLFFSSRHILNAVHYSLHSKEQCRKKALWKITTAKTP